MSFEISRAFDGVDEWRDAESSKGTVDQAPPDWDFTNGTANEGEREDEDG